MSIRVSLNHKTSYRYSDLVRVYPQVVRLRPAPHCRTPIISYSLKVTPKQHFLNWQQDPQGNFLARLVFPDKMREFQVEVGLVAEMTVINPFDFFLEPSADAWPFVYEPTLAEELKPFLAAPPPGDKLRDFVAGVSRHSRRTIDFLVEINQSVQHAVGYVIRLDPGVQTCEQTLELRSGSCRDSAWLMVQVLRNLGLAARFVSGYLIQLKPDVASLDGPSGADRDFTDLHAWTEVYLPGAGWVGLDPTSGLFAGEGHIPLACTPEPASAAPISGGVDPCESKFDFSMSVTRIHEDPRVTKPYTEEQWQQIEALGHRIDGQLEAAAVRLTMGGEPTFVSIDDMDGDEWNFTAHGAHKRQLAGVLIKRMRERFAPGGLLHYGQGKWYPGEPLPRWALGCYWRKDGQPIWNNPDLIADTDTKTNFGESDSLNFVSALSERLGVDPQFAVPAHEDVWYYLAQERRLPVNVDPLKANLKDELDRQRLSRVIERGLGSVVGYALPLEPIAGDDGASWRSGPWFVRQQQMFLMPGDSPMGLRLPLDSLPWTAPADREPPYDIDPFAPRGPLPQHSAPQHTAPSGNGTYWRDSTNGHTPSMQPMHRAARVGVLSGGVPSGSAALSSDSSIGLATLEYPALATAPTSAPAVGQSDRTLVRSALCVEARDGKLHVFMPPIKRLEDYLELITAVEETATSMNMPIIVEGYPPPHDHRLNCIKATPDPGVIEVNIHPANNWSELVENTVALYEDARLCRLGTEKFMLDGKHSGTGGGNHIVIGGPTAADSPMLRRPDVLRSLIAYWNNHPSLSYLFSGTFVGPTSQSPRVDEARHDSLYELEIAFTQIPDDGNCPPWLVDRALRHLLVDLTGNTHRAEFCIDKLFSPDSATGRLGLVEFRAFEMPPHARMSLTQQLLLRALIARFWKVPYKQRLVRWGTTLHDRFLLPHFVQQDFADVISELQRAGFDMQPEWFDAHLEFRFPLIGTLDLQGLHVELRHAIEPWNVLGEEVAASGTARYVDSSVERLQIKVSGMTDSRHVVACNGRRVPLHPTGTVGQSVAGVRYRAWQPPSCLHPTIPIHTPLVFDLIDSWSERSIGGCTWHVAHPGGNNSTSFPVNAYAAESRRVARFFRQGHSPGPLKTPPVETNPDFPLTLDLRRPTS